MLIDLLLSILVWSAAIALGVELAAILPFGTFINDKKFAPILIEYLKGEKKLSICDSPDMMYFREHSTYISTAGSSLFSKYHICEEGRVIGRFFRWGICHKMIKSEIKRLKNEQLCEL